MFATTQVVNVRRMPATGARPVSLDALSAHARRPPGARGTPRAHADAAATVPVNTRRLKA